MDKIIKDLQPITMLVPFQSSAVQTMQPWQADFSSVLLNQHFEEKTSTNSSNLMKKYRYLTKVSLKVNRLIIFYFIFMYEIITNK